MRYVIHLIPLAIMAGFIIGLYGCNDGGGNKNIEKKIDRIKQFSFIYDKRCVDYENRQLADTLFRKVGMCPRDGEPHLLYVATGDCSFCISRAMDYLLTFYTIYKQEVPTVALKGGDEIFRYYLEKNELIPHSVKICVIDDDVAALDGMYLIVDNRVVNYATWEE